MKLVERITNRHNDFGKSHVDKHSVRTSQWRHKNGLCEYKKYAFPSRALSDNHTISSLEGTRSMCLDWGDCHHLYNKLIRIRQDIGTKHYV